MAAILKLVCDSIMSMGLQNLQFATKIQLPVKNSQPTTKNRIAFISMASILYFSILGLIPYFDSVDPVLIGFSMLRTTSEPHAFIRKCTCLPPDVTYRLSYYVYQGIMATARFYEARPQVHVDY